MQRYKKYLKCESRNLKFTKLFSKQYKVMSVQDKSHTKLTLNSHIFLKIFRG